MSVLLEDPPVDRRYTEPVADNAGSAGSAGSADTTTIKVGKEVRDRLMELARERGITMRDLVAELAEATPTQEELRERYEATRAYVEKHFLGRPYTEEDAEAGERFWRDVVEGRQGEVQ